MIQVIPAPRALALALLGLLATAGIVWLFQARQAPGVTLDAPARSGVSAQAPAAIRAGADGQPGAPPALPSSLYGYVDGAAVGGVVSAAVGGAVVAEARVIVSEGRPFYALNVPADDPATPAVEGGSPGVAVELRVAGRPAGSAPWEPGGNRSLDLPAPAAP